MTDRGAIHVGGDSLGLVDNCKECGRVKWAGHSDDCPSCKAKRQWSDPPDHSATMTDTVPQEKQ